MTKTGTLGVLYVLFRGFAVADEAGGMTNDPLSAKSGFMIIPQKAAILDESVDEKEFLGDGNGGQPIVGKVYLTEYTELNGWYGRMTALV